jgi:hypothetical protein
MKTNDQKIRSPSAGHKVITATSKSQWSRVASDNSAALASLSTRQLLVDVSKNIVPSKRLEKGMPIVRGNKFLTAALSPNGNDSASKSSRCGANL